MAVIVGHSQTKGRANSEPNYGLHHRATSRLYPDYPLLHGEPSWSFLYPRMIPRLAKRGRVLAPDLFGFGKSDKVSDRADYSYRMHRDAVLGFLDALAIRDITLVCQDWGGLIGLQLAASTPSASRRW